MRTILSSEMCIRDRHISACRDFKYRSSVIGDVGLIINMIELPVITKMETITRMEKQALMKSDSLPDGEDAKNFITELRNYSASDKIGIPPKLFKPE